MRLLFLAPVFLLAAAPAAAQYHDSRDDEIVRALPTPGEMADVSDMIGRVMSAMMDIEIGGVVEAIDPGARGPRDRTLRDMAGRDDPYFEDRMRRSVYGAVTDMGDIMTDITILTPRLRRSLEDLGRDVDDAVRDLPSRR
ncbi:hypothetical protein [Allosphingosinicella vermicomposti]|uniref:hypothetical protein n=1 Tax=Allosphingosinicella vermicomposti TaxID=614671 RepID=UPI000D0FE511|nr:hypothetical protein [Allosphingosinicella vermicomposti]